MWLSESKVNGKIEIIFVDNKFIRRLNKEFLNKDSDTDVIAFPLSKDETKLFEGEIYISLDKVKEQAQRFHVNSSEELRRLVIHGILHFLGYRDKTNSEKRIMTHRENFYLGLNI